MALLVVFFLEKKLEKHSTESHNVHFWSEKPQTLVSYHKSSVVSPFVAFGRDEVMVNEGGE